MVNVIGIAGAGTMGQGIAQVSAAAGFMTLVYDSNPTAIDVLIERIRQNLEALMHKGKITHEQLQSACSLIVPVHKIEQLKADLIIEAVVEDLVIKSALLKQIESVNGGACILATNTSSLRVDSISEQLKFPEMFVGIHFFNPATAMKLVEVVPASKTAIIVLERVLQFLRSAGKTVVRSNDTPGFIVNRITRHYYLEALQLLGEGTATVAEIDLLMRSSGFKMGPFELMDLIGIDINYAVSSSVYKAFHDEPRFKPHPIQQEKVERGKLGRKSGEGFYKYQGREKEE